MSDLPDLLQLTELEERRYRVFQPSESAEGRDVVFSGQLLGQMLMAADRAGASAKTACSIHTVFARPGSYTKPIEVSVESMHAGRSWASDTVSATQDGRLLCRGIVLSNAAEPDVMRHDPLAPAGVLDPDILEPASSAHSQAFPGSQVRPVPGELTWQGVPVEMSWLRFERPLASQAANQAVLVWSTCAQVIALGMRPHSEAVRIEDAHRTLATGVIGHTVHFTDVVDVAQWLLMVTEATKAGAGRVHGGGRVFTQSGSLVATFHQDSMVKAADGPPASGRYR